MDLIWFWLAAVLAVWTLIVVTAVRWLQANKEAGERHDAVMAEHYDQYVRAFCVCGHAAMDHDLLLIDDTCWYCDCPTWQNAEFSLGRVDRPPSDPGD